MRTNEQLSIINNIRDAAEELDFAAKCRNPHDLVVEIIRIQKNLAELLETLEVK